MERGDVVLQTGLEQGEERSYAIGSVRQRLEDVFVGLFHEQVVV